METLDSKDLLAALKKANENIAALDGKNKELASRMLDIEQKGTHRPSGGGADSTSMLMPAFEASDGFKAMLKGQTKSCRIEVPAKALERKNIYSAVSGGYVSAADRSSVITAPNAQRLRMRDLLPAVPTTQGSTEFLRELTFTNNAGPQGGIASPTENGGQGEVKNASDMALQLVSSPVVTITHHFTVSRQALDDSAALQSHLENRGLYGYAVEVEDEILASTGASGQLDGLMNNASAFTGGSTGLSKADIIRKSITQLAVANHIATAVVLNPVDAEALELAKDSQSRYLGVVLYVDGQPYIWRIAIVESNSQTAGQFLTGAFAEAATIRDRQEAHIEISLDHADYRTRNLALILIEGRLGLEIHRQTALVKGALTY